MGEVGETVPRRRKGPALKGDVKEAAQRVEKKAMTQHKEGHDARTARKAVSPSSRGSDGGGGAAFGMRQWVGLGAGPVLLLLMLLFPAPEGLRVEG